MIKTRVDFKNTLKREFISNEIKHTVFLRQLLCLHPSWKFIKALRRCEYLRNVRKNAFDQVLYLIALRKYRKLSLKLGYSIPLNVADKGLTLPHWGTIVISPFAHISENCMIQVGVNIGAKEGESVAPFIGKDVYIGPGAKIFGNISIADGCYIGANSIVNRSIPEKGSVVVGSPARVVRKESLTWWQKNNLDL